MKCKNILWQTKEWEQYQQAIGNETFRLHDVLIIKRKTAFGKSFYEIPRADGSKLKTQFWKDLQKKALEERIIFSRVFPTNPPSAFPEKYRQKNVPEIFPEHSLIIDLRQSEDVILKDMKQKGRYNINLARKKEVQVEKSDDVSAFYAMLKDTCSRDKFSVHPESVYRKMLGAFGEKGMLLLAKYDEKIIAGGIFLHAGDFMTYYYGASSNEYRNIMAPYLVQWTAIQMAKKRKCRWYDFLGIAPEENAKSHRLYGVSQFKTKFGGIRKTYPPAFEIVYAKGWDRIIRGLKKVRSVFS